MTTYLIDLSEAVVKTTQFIQELPPEIPTDWITPPLVAKAVFVYFRTHLDNCLIWKALSLDEVRELCFALEYDVENLSAELHHLLIFHFDQLCCDLEEVYNDLMGRHVSSRSWLIASIQQHDLETLCLHVGEDYRVWDWMRRFGQSTKDIRNATTNQPDGAD